ncbi:MAG: DUF58 domain-containing protein [Proteobacteria bacterium]|nr:DUF58 domain-containing protein [Pseudomonadota bacterium]
MALFSQLMPKTMRARIDAWIARRNPPSREKILLHNRRLYILPTRFGYLFSVMLALLFLAAINYQNSMAFVLTFMLTALGIISLWQTHKNLLDLEVDLLSPRPVFMGEPSEFLLNFEHRNNSFRYAVGVQYAGQVPAYLSIGPRGKAQALLKIPTHKRGQFRPKGLTVFTRYPTGLFHAWGWLQFDTPILIYPKPLFGVTLQETMVEQPDGKTSTSTIEGDDFAGLREHRKGESLRHISWKAYAQGKGLLTKTFQGQARPSLWIDWYQIPQGSIESKLSHMTALAILAENENQKYGVRLPGKTIDQDSGTAHKLACLYAIATFRQVDFDQEFDPDEQAD